MNAVEEIWLNPPPLPKVRGQYQLWKVNGFPKKIGLGKSIRNFYRKRKK